ncbi:MAG: hypothetical protein HY556_06930 [Euryarchaeota archaeon]|nr:hypothetical protein [Euryarchaeota archaeon]
MANIYATNKTAQLIARGLFAFSLVLFLSGWWHVAAAGGGLNPFFYAPLVISALAGLLGRDDAIVMLDFLFFSIAFTVDIATGVSFL